MSDEVNVTQRILDKLNKIDDKVNETQIDIAEIKVDLNYHVKRTDLAEANIAEVRKESNRRLEKLEKWSAKFHFVGWILTGLLGSGEVIIRIFDYLKHR